MAIPFLDLQAQYRSIKAEIAEAIQQVLDTASFALGPSVEQFENAFAAYCDSTFCIGVNSGTSAITLLLEAHDIGPGDEVITAPNSFFASAEAISNAGAIPRFCDVDPATANMDANKLEAAITKKTKAILAVHLYGQPADMDSIKEVAKKHKLLVFEDAAQAHGALYKAKKAGSLADGACFSFYPGKNLGAYGEAGGIVTNNEKIAIKIRMLRDHGSNVKYIHEQIGANERIDGIQGAILSVKLKYIEKWNETRRALAARYHEQLKTSSKVTLLQNDPNCVSNYHLMIVRSKNRDALQKHLKDKGIATGIHYPIAIHLQSAYKDLGFKEGDFPHAEALCSEVISLPMFAELTIEQVNEVCDAIEAFRA